MQIHFIHQMVLIYLYSNELMLKIIEKCKRIQTKKRFHISWVQVFEDAINVFNKGINSSMQVHFIYLMVFIQLYSTELMLKNIEKCVK